MNDAYDRSNWLSDLEDFEWENDKDDDEIRLDYYEQLASSSLNEYMNKGFNPSINNPVSGTIRPGKNLQETSTSTYHKPEVVERPKPSMTLLRTKTTVEVIKEAEKSMGKVIEVYPAYVPAFVVGFFCKLPVTLIDRDGKKVKAGTVVEVTRVEEGIVHMSYIQCSCPVEVFKKAGIKIELPI